MFIFLLNPSSYPWGVVLWGKTPKRFSFHAKQNKDKEVEIELRVLRDVSTFERDFIEEYINVG